MGDVFPGCMRVAIGKAAQAHRTKSVDAGAGRSVTDGTAAWLTSSARFAPCTRGARVSCAQMCGYRVGPQWVAGALRVDRAHHKMLCFREKQSLDAGTRASACHGCVTFAAMH